MAPRIGALDPVTIGKISAGEVVERPASVAKEMLENSLDAGALSITLEARDGGGKYLRATDDGCGISKEDAPNLFKRHSTSKLSSIDDLESLRTLGFRGEALAAIASVSRLELVSSTDGLDGFKVTCEGGSVLGTSAFGCAKGTTIRMSDLFYNTPARKKFLRSKATETNHIIDIATRYALARPDVHVRLIIDGSTALDTPATKDPIGNIASIYGTPTARAMREVKGAVPGTAVRGYSSLPDVNKGSSSFISIFVNGRYVRSTGIVQALLDGYRTRLMKHRYPVSVLFLDVDPSSIDVNIHPTKTEVRFRNEKAVMDLMRDSVADALRETDVPAMGMKDSAAFEFDVMPPVRREVPLEPQRAAPPAQRQVPLVAEGAGGMRSIACDYIDIPAELFSTSQVPRMRPLGQVHNTYIVAETREGMLIIDQHAAHERVNLERIEDGLGSGASLRQQMVAPLSVALDRKQMNLLLENRGALEELGFELEEFGKDAALVRSVPVVLSREVGQDVLCQILEEIVTLGRSKALDKFRDDVSHLIACKASIKAGDTLTREQVEKLVLGLYGARKPYSCAHGRPTMLSLTKTDLEKRFKRTV